MQPTDLLTEHFRLKEDQAKALKRLKIETISDLLYHFPARYENLAEGRKIKDLISGEKALVYGKLQKLKAKKAWKSKKPMAEGRLEDDTGSVDVLWFHQPYLAKMFNEGQIVKIEGKVSERNGKLSFLNPEVERATHIPTNMGTSLLGDVDDSATSFPVYPESRGITSRWFYYALQKIFAAGVHEELEDPLPENIRKKYNLPGLASALIWAHTPKNEKDSRAARKRFAFEEVFFIQLKNAQARAESDAKPSWIIDPHKGPVDDFIKRFPFTLTDAQARAIKEINKDFTTPHAMSRLLEGDVGSGKTAVAAATTYAVALSHPNTTEDDNSKKKDFGNLQVAYMAPTEILAKQLYESFIEYFKHLPVQIGLITSSGCRKFPSKVDPSGWTDISRTQLLKWVANGEIPILIGTHSLIQKTVTFKHLAYVIIDEQHRFGTMQRQKLTKKDEVMPHLLSMTATPIPRTLALTIYGDLDLTLLDEMPSGRKPVITHIVKEDRRGEMYDMVRERLAEGRQAYVITPRIDEPDETKVGAVIAKSVTAETKRLQKEEFADYTVGMLHGKMTAKKKDEVMLDFEAGKIDVLVSTSVVEVGVNVPNATSILIEGAERFGLAQLHQLRGRVLRSAHQAYCYIVPATKAAKSLERLQALQDARTGFELAEKDLQFRGSGELYGKRQWGVSDIGMEAIQNIKMVEAARNEAQALIANDPELAEYPLLAIQLESRGEIHFE